MKTRTNQPIELMSTADIEHLSDSFLNQIKAGDIITKRTGNMKHTYVVSYKEEKHGICITYVACGYMETISYDYTDGHWVFNSKDVIEVQPVEPTKLYLHMVRFKSGGVIANITNTSNTAITFDDIKALLTYEGTDYRYLAVCGTFTTSDNKQAIASCLYFYDNKVNCKYHTSSGNNFVEITAEDYQGDTIVEL